MSPTEDELRRALHSGEGERIDVNRIVAAGSAKRAQRRGALVAASLVGLFTATALTVGIATSGGDGGTGLNDAGAPPPAASSSLPRNAQPGATGGNASGATRSDSPSSGYPTQSSPNDQAVPCPPFYPQELASRTPTAPAASLYPGTVRAAVVCAYGSDLDIARRARPAATTVTGSAAESLARSLDAAPRTRTGRTCLPTRTQHLVLYAISETGAAYAPVYVTFGATRCDGRITNGAALRYGWVPPAGLRGVLGTLSPSATASLPDRPSSGKSHGPGPTK